jgi:hypothetical protein
MAESQLPFPYTPADIAYLRAAISSPRFATYLQRAGNDEVYALGLYLYNARLAKAFLFPLNVVEVTLRNGIDESLMAVHGAAWPFNQNFREKVLTPDGLKTLDKAIERVGRNVTKDDVVATLTFDFWSNLFRPEYGSFWRTKLNIVLPNLPRGEKRHDVQGALREINRFRNRIAHHEPILDLNAVDVMARIKTVVGYRCAVTEAWMRHHSTIAHALRTRPVPQGGIGVRLVDRQDPGILRVTGTETISFVLSQLGARQAVVRVDAVGAPTGACSADAILSAIGAQGAKLEGFVSLEDLTIEQVLGPPGPAPHWKICADGEPLQRAVTMLQRPLIKILVGVNPTTGVATGALLRAHRRY